MITVAMAATTAAGLAVPQALSTPAFGAASRVDAVRLNGFEAALVADINAARRNAGLRPLTVVAGPTDVARRWSWRMAKGQSLLHNPSLVSNLEHAGSRAWTMIAENVGMGPAGDPDALFQAYMNSAPHKANILDGSSRFLGVGTVERGGISWNTLDFTNAYSNTYGHTRVPADGLPMDTRAITRTTEVASLEAPDQRFTSGRQGSVRASRVHYTGPSRRNDAAFTRLSKSGHSGGKGSLLMRDALDLSQADGLTLQLALRNPRHRAVPVRIVLRRSFGDSVTLGTVRVGARHRWISFDLPAGARGFRNALSLEVGAKALRAAGGRGRLAVYDVRARV
jgi:uncharacterized protein YkwD